MFSPKFKKPSIYGRLSNKLFLGLSTSLLEGGLFKRINNELRKANLYFLPQTYISMAFSSSVIAFLASIVLLIVLLFFNLSFELPFLIRVEESIFLRLIKNFWIKMYFLTYHPQDPYTLVSKSVLG